MKVETEYNIGDKVWVVYERNGNQIKKGII